MLLALDIGNTSITVGIFQGKRLFATWRIPTYPLTYAVSLRRVLKRCQAPFGARHQEIEAVILSSVVPKATVSLKRALSNLGLPRAIVLGENIQAPVINRYRIPSQVGQDRLVNAAAAYFLYGGPAMVVDFGTAVTVDLVNGRREYLGGLIAPGMEIALEALSSRAALLPRIPLAPPKDLLGRDTVSSMKAGLFYGYGALCDGIVNQLRSRYAPRAKVIATGGHAKQIAPFCRSVQIVKPELTLLGLELIYRKATRR